MQAAIIKKRVEAAPPSDRVDIVVAGIECADEFRAELRSLVRALFGDSAELEIGDRRSTEDTLTGDTLLTAILNKSPELLGRRGKYVYFLTREVRESLSAIRVRGWDDAEHGILDGKAIFECEDPASLLAAIKKAGSKPAPELQLIGRG